MKNTAKDQYLGNLKNSNKNLQEEIKKLKLTKLDKEKELNRLININSPKDNKNLIQKDPKDSKDSKQNQQLKLLNKKVKIESREINNKNENKKNNPLLNSGDLRLPNINKSVALRKLKETMDQNLEKFHNEKKGILKENNFLKKSASKKEYNNEFIIDEEINHDNNNKKIKKNSTIISPRMKSVDFNNNNNTNKIRKVNESINSDFEKEKENDENINEISNMMKDILNI